MTQIKQIYIAGPEVFLPDMGVSYYDKVRKILSSYDIKALIPIDNKVSTASDIREKNLEMIRECDAVIADLSPFRSHEPDVGTAFEVGYASALNKTVVTFTSDRRSLIEKYNGLQDENGLTVENFNLPFNLMLVGSTEVFSSFDDAFKYLIESYSIKE